MRNVMVTGGCGFMGSHFVDVVLPQVDKVVVVDKLSYAGNIKNLDLTLPKLRFYLMDIASPEMVHVLKMEQIDTIVNFAAETHVDRSITHPKAFLETDVMGLFNLAYWAMKTKVELFLQVSTDEVYGPMLEGEADETFPLNPTSPYSASKACAELLLQSYHKTYGLPLVIVRCCNNFGPRQYPEKLIPMAITRLLDDKPVLLHGHGEEIREWIYVRDCCEYIYRVLTQGETGGIYNVGSGVRHTNYEIVDWIIWSIIWNYGDVKGGSRSIKEWIKNIPTRPNNDFRYAINSSKVRNLFSPYKHEIKLDLYSWQDLQKTIDWYKENKNWWEGVVDLDSNLYKEGESLR